MAFTLNDIPASSPLIVRSGIPEIDGCKIWNAIKAFVVSQGVPAVLEHTLRDRHGKPLDLHEAFGNELMPDSESEQELGVVKVRIKEPLSTSSSSVTNPIWELPATIVSAPDGIIRVRLTKEIVEYAGVYTVSWALFNEDDDPIWIEESFMMVDKTLYPKITKTLTDNLGPPTLNDIRLTLMDRSAAENDLLNRLEFTDDQVLFAIINPVQYYNEQPPPIGTFTTRNFPWSNAWLDAIAGNLLMAAAHNYRRNALPNTTGGVSINDKAKEPEYMKMAQMLLQSFKDFVINKKVEINLKGIAGSIGSPYGRGWRL